MAKTYILQKNLPDSLKGDKYIWNESMRKYCLNGNVIGVCYNSYVVELNSEWFVEYIPKIYTEDDMRACFEASRELQLSKRFTWKENKYFTFEDYLKAIL